MLIFEDRPLTHPDKRALTITISALIVIIFTGLSQGYIRFHDLLFGLLFWTAIMVCSLAYGQLYPVRVKINKPHNVVSLSNLSSRWNPWGPNKVETALSSIRKIQHSTWTSPYPFYLFNFIFNWGKLVFILDENRRVEINTLGFLVSYKNYANIGKRIADYINVPFDICLR